MPRLSRKAVLLIGFVIGLGLWLTPTLLLGMPVPWDGHGPAYPLALFAVGLILGWLGPGRPGAAVAGVFLGQLVILVWRTVALPESRELWLVTVVLLAGYTFVASGIGALLGSALRRRLGPDAAGDRRVADRRTEA
jgi:hypothetical protein